MSLLKRYLLSALLLPATLAAQDRYRIETFAGGPAPEGTVPTATFFRLPQGLAFDSRGNLFVAEVNAWRIRKIAAESNLVSVAGGAGVSGYSGSGGPVLSASFGAPRYVAFDAHDNMYVADSVNCVVWRVDGATGTSMIYAGVGPAACGYNGDHQTAISAQLNQPRGIALDAAGDLFIADAANNRVRRVDLATLQITTVAGTGATAYNGENIAADTANLQNAQYLAVDSAGNLYIADNGHHRIRRVDAASRLIATYAGTGQKLYNGDNIPAVEANLSADGPMAFDGGENLFLLDGENRRVRRIDGNSHIITTYAGNGQSGYSGDGGPATSATFESLGGIAVNRSGGVFISDSSSNVIRKVTPGTVPVISTFAGSLGPENVAATSGFLLWPGSLTMDATGKVLILDRQAHRIRQLNEAGLISTIAGNGLPGYKDNVLAASATFYQPADIAIDGAGNYYIADLDNNAIRRVDGATGRIATIAGNGRAGYNGDGAATSSELWAPSGVAVDSNGDVYIADTNNSMVRKVSGGTLTTIAGTSAGPGYNGDNIPASRAQLDSPTSVAVDPVGNIYIADAGNHLVREIVKATGNIITMAGTGAAGYNGDGAATAAQLNRPSGVGLTPAGDLIVADTNNHLVRRIAAGQTTLETIAGNTTAGSGGDGGAATEAQLADPTHVTADPSGRIYVADGAGSVVRRLTPQYSLSTSVTPEHAGTVTAGGYFDENSIARIAAAANSGFVFAGFTGSATGALPLNLTMNGTKSVVANFSIVARDFSKGQPRVAGSCGGQPGATVAQVDQIINQALGIATPANDLNSDGVVNVVDAQIEIQAIAGCTVSITNAPLPLAVAGATYGPVQVQATGGSGAYSFTATGLPANLTISTSGAISGTPTTAGSASVKVTVTDTTTHQTATATFPMTINPPVSITTTSLPNGAAGISYTTQVVASGGSRSYSFSAAGLPAGLGISISGFITGTPSAAGTTTFSVTVKDTTTQQTASANLSIMIISGGGSGGLTVTGATVGYGLQQLINVTLSPAPTAALTVTIQSSNSTAVYVAGRASDVGSAQISFQISANTTTFSVYAQGRSSSGSSTITVSATGYSSGTSTVNLAPSAFVVDGGNGPGGSFTTTEGAVTNLTVTPYMLNSGAASQVQAIAGGTTVTVPLAVASSTYGSASPLSLTFTGASTSQTSQFTATSTPGSTTITVTEPTGFTTPSDNSNVVVVTVKPNSVTAGSATVGYQLEEATLVTLQGAATSNITVTITSNDPTKLLLSTDGVSAGQSSINLTIQSGFSRTPSFYVYGLVKSGSATYTANVPGFGSANGTVSFAPSGFVLVGPFGLGVDFSTTTGSPQSANAIDVQSYQLDSSGNLVTAQPVAGGLTVNVNITSSQPAFGTMSGSPAVFTGGVFDVGARFQPLTDGTTLLSASASGFTTPTAGASLHATVTTPQVTVSAATVGFNLQQASNFFLGEPAPSGGVTVTFTASGPLKLSTTGTDAGSTSITVAVAANGQSGLYYIYGEASSGTGTITASAPGYLTGSATITLAPSGVVIWGPFGAGADLTTTVAAGNQPVTISMAQLDSSANFVQTQPLAGGGSLTVSLSNTSPTVGTVPSSAVITGGSTSTDVNFTPVNGGGQSTMISVGTPAGGYTKPGQYASLKATVN